jgi:predicted membrane chloride channel (bestrophin family)
MGAIRKKLKSLIPSRERLLNFKRQEFRRYWWRILPSIRGTVSCSHTVSNNKIWQYTLVRTFFLVCVTIMLNLLDHYGYKIPPFKNSAHTLLGVALGLLLVYRTNAAYDRFWEGRKAWVINTLLTNCNRVRLTTTVGTYCGMCERGSGL